MTATNHALTGAVIALTVKNPAIAVPLSFVSHFIQDLVPHFDFFSGPDNQNLFKRRFNIALATDMIVSITILVVLTILFPAHRLILWTCMFAAVCPDLAQAYYFLYLEHIKKRQPKFDPLSKLHYAIQWNSTPQGLFVEIAWFLIFGAIILSLR